MSQPWVSLRFYSRIAALCLSVLALFPATSVSASKGPTSAECLARANDTPSRLLECVQTKDLWNHMQQFEAIAKANPGPDGHPSRNSGEPGYKASADYVASAMQAAGYSVVEQPYTFEYYAYKGTPSFSEVSPTAHTYLFGTDWGPGRSIGIAQAALQPAGGI